MSSSRWIAVETDATVYPSDHRGGATTDASGSAFAETLRRGVVLHALYVTGQHATESATITISGVPFRVPPVSERTLYGSEAYVQLGGPSGWLLMDGFSVSSTHTEATCVVWYSLL